MEPTTEEREAAEAEKRMAEHREKVHARERMAREIERDERIAADLAAHGIGEGPPIINGPSVAVAFSEAERKAMLDDIERDQEKRRAEAAHDRAWLEQMMLTVPAMLDEHTSRMRTLLDAQTRLALAETELAVASLRLVNAQLDALKAR